MQHANTEAKTTWVLVKLTNGESFVARPHKEDALTLTFIDVVHTVHDEETGTYVIEVDTHMRFVNRNAVIYRDILDEVIQIGAEYDDWQELPAVLAAMYFSV